MRRARGSDVVIIGAGLAGCATAYYLAKEGVKATIIDRDSVGAHASGFALGAINPLGGVGIPEPLGPLSLESYRLHTELAKMLPQESGVDTEFQLRNALMVAYSQEEAQAMQAHLPWQQAQKGFRVEWKSGEEIAAMERHLAPGMVGGVVMQRVGMVSPYRFNLALLQAAERHGAVLRHGRVVGFRYQNNRIQAVQLEREEVPCHAVVVAMGPWSADASAWLGVDIPVTPLKGQILHLRIGGPGLSYVSWGHSYAVTKPDGLVWVGTTEERAGYDESPSAVGSHAIMGPVLKALPYLADAEVVRQTACLRPVTADGLPILGKVSGKEGVVVATGGGRKGIHLGPVMGRIAADLVVHGKTKFDVAAVAPGRIISTVQIATSESDPFRF